MLQKLTPLLFIIGLGFCSIARAQTPSTNHEASDQIHRDLTFPNVNSQEYTPPRTIPDFTDILKNFHGGYSVSFMGSRINGSSNETYNIYLPDVSSIQLYHTVKLGYQVNENLQIGINENIVQNLADGIVSPKTGSVYNRSFEWYDPNIYFNLPHLIEIPGWFVSTIASFSLPIGPTSQADAKITSIIIEQSWGKMTFPSKWGYGFKLYLNPQFYNDPLPAGYTNRQTLSFSFGPDLNYSVSPLFSLGALANFNVEHRSPDSKGSFHLGEGLPDYFKLTATVYPEISPLLMSIGGYFQSLVWNPSGGTSIFGASFSIAF